MYYNHFEIGHSQKYFTVTLDLEVQPKDGAIDRKLMNSTSMNSSRTASTEMLTVQGGWVRKLQRQR